MVRIKEPLLPSLHTHSTHGAIATQRVARPGLEHAGPAQNSLNQRAAGSVVDQAIKGREKGGRGCYYLLLSVNAVSALYYLVGKGRASTPNTFESLQLQ